MLSKTNKIDFVILWVDGNDPKWQEERSKYTEDVEEQDGSSKRYRDWENLQYWFRSVEKYAPWVNKIFFITCGQHPEWLNKEHPKLRVVDHQEFIPKEDLPTFNSNAIEVNLHRISELSEQFVLFNDDMFLTDYVKPEDFFVNGLPVDMFMEYPVGCYGGNVVMSHIFINNFNLIGKYYTRKEILKNLKNKILTFKYGMGFFYNLIFYLLPFPNFFGIHTFHFAYPHLKSTFEKMWIRDEKPIKDTSSHKFRDKEDISHYIFRAENMLSGNFVARNRMKMGKLYHIGKNESEMYRAIQKHKYKLICIADEVSDEEFDKVKAKLLEEFEKSLPQKSKFEY